LEAVIFSIRRMKVYILKTLKNRVMQADVLAGASVAALVVPQGMSYASLAGLPSVYGLYGAFVPVLCYAALGSSRHLVGLTTHPPITSFPCC
jgi:MFS superfamily sulfate permease-like transporter